MVSLRPSLHGKWAFPQRFSCRSILAQLSARSCLLSVLDRASRAIDRVVAEGLATRHAQENNVTEMLDLVDQMQLVSDEEILRAIYRLLIDEHIVAEPAGAASTAALLQSDHLQAGEKVVLIVTGANIEGELLRRAVLSHRSDKV